MDKIWDRNSFEVGGHWPLWRGGKKTNDHAEPTKVLRSQRSLAVVAGDEKTQMTTEIVFISLTLDK